MSSPDETQAEVLRLTSPRDKERRRRGHLTNLPADQGSGGGPKRLTKFRRGRAECEGSRGPTSTRNKRAKVKNIAHAAHKEK